MPKTDESHDNDQNEELEDDQEVETSQEEDENQDDTKETAEDEDNDDENEEESEDEDSDEESEDEEEPKFKKAFSQIKGETPEEYSQNLEEAYRKSSREGKRLAQEQKELQSRMDAIAAVVEKNPELKKAVEAATGEGALAPTVDPALVHARNEMNRKMEEDYAAFAKDHPDIDTDEDIQAKVLEEVALLGELYRKKGQILSMDKALKRAWTNLGLDEDESKEKIALKAKEQASKSKNNSTNKKVTKKSTLSAEQIKMGKRMGLTEEQLTASLDK